MQHRFGYADGEDDDASDVDGLPMDLPMMRPHNAALRGPGPGDPLAGARRAQQPPQGRKTQPEVASRSKGGAADKGGGKGGPGMHAGAADRCELFVGRLSLGVTEQMLRELFRSRGIEVRSLKLPMDPLKNTNKGYAFVGLSNPAQMRFAIEHLNGQPLDGRPINVEVSGASLGKGDGKGDQKGSSAAERDMGLLSSMAQRTQGKGAGAGKSSDQSMRPEGLMGANALARGGDKGGDGKGGGKRKEKGGGAGKFGKGPPMPGDLHSSMGKMKTGNSPNKLFVGNLPADATSEDVSEALQLAGEVVSVRVVEGAYSSIAFVEFRDPASVVSAVRQLQGISIKGKPARLEFQSSKGQGKGASNNTPVEVPATAPAASAPSPAPAASCIPGVLAPGPLPPGPMAGNKPPVLPKGVAPLPGAADGLTPGMLSSSGQ